MPVFRSRTYQNTVTFIRNIPPYFHSGVLAVLPREQTGIRRPEHQDQGKKEETRPCSDTLRSTLGKQEPLKFWLVGWQL